MSDGKQVFRPLRHDHPRRPLPPGTVMTLPGERLGFLVSVPTAGYDPRLCKSRESPGPTTVVSWFATFGQKFFVARLLGLDES